MRLHLTLAAAVLVALPLSCAIAQNRTARAPAAPQACTDFYGFANATWLRANPLPSGTDTLSRLGQMQAQTETTRNRLISEVLAAPNSDAERLLAEFWSAGMNTAALDAGSAAAVQNALKPLGSLKRARDLPKVSAEFHAIGLAPMIEFVRLGNDANGQLAAVPTPLGLNDPAFYTRQEPEIRTLLGKYRAYVEALMRASGLPEAEISPASEAVLQIETQIAQALDAEADDARQSDSLRAQDRRYAALGLVDVLKRLDTRTDDLVVLNPAYFATLAQLGTRETPQRLQWYLRFRVLNRLAPDLGAAFRNAHTGFFVNTLQGLPTAPRREDQLTATLREQLPGLIDHVVNARLVDAATRTRAQSVLQAVQTAATAKDPAFGAVRIDLAGSLQPPFSAEGLRFDAQNHIGNLLRLWLWHDQRALKGTASAVSPLPAITPTVQFDASSKTLTVTAAALAAPLLGAAPGAADFGGLGALAGHELSKAVDSSTRATGLGPLYNGIDVAPGLRVDGARTLAMNRADLAGLEFAWAAFSTAQPKPDAAAKKAFFQAWAELWAAQQSPAALRATVQTSPYAPAVARVNGPLSQLPAIRRNLYLPRRPENARGQSDWGVALMPLVPGQRWFSSAEPELGLGTVLRIAGRSVQMVFTASGMVRQYSLEAAPLMRAQFRVGDRVRVDNREIIVETVEERAGLLYYRAADGEYMEGQLDAEQPVSKADARLISGRIDRNDQFERRVRTLEARAQARSHPGWGVLGARIDLVPHQLRVIETAAARRTPRLLLADEVGLGKTIEACAIAAQQIASGRAKRVLVLTPESLVNQWFVELLRRFNLPFAIYDEERCEALEMNEPSRNPFEDEQFVLASVGWLTEHDKRMKQVVKAGWDLLLVDEAHHLIWTSEFESPGYTLVDALAKRTPGLLLLTATPEQLGRGGHFARLRLLDPARYTNLKAFLAESDGFVALSALAERIELGTINAADRAELATLFHSEPEWLAATLALFDAGEMTAANALLDALVDRHGTGRVMVRNRRAAVGGFPKRIPHVDLLPASDDSELLGRLRAEFAFEVGDLDEEPVHDYAKDPRLDWLLDTLQALGGEKALVLCRSRAKVQALEEALRLRWGQPVARFHEDMNLLQRDRNAAFFADPDGARVLIASEVGAEGRNFQFAQHLVLWDLPLHPDMLEQRIGRLDRIGQPGDVHIHAVAISGSAQDVLLRWYHEGLEAFSGVVPDGRELLRRFVEDLVMLAESNDSERETGIQQLLVATRAAHAELSEQIARGRDRLLERASQRADTDELRAALAADDFDLDQHDAMLDLLEAFGIQNEPLDDKRVLLDPEYLTVDGFDGLKGGPREATSDRALALSRDDLLYLRADHPMILGAQDLLLSSELGNACLLIDETLPPRTALLEAVYVLECVAQSGLNIERFLPPTPLRATVDTRLQRRSDFTPDEDSRQKSGDRAFDLSPMRKVLNSLVPPMLGACETAARRDAATRIAESAEAAETRLGGELRRLEALAKVNPAVSAAEVQALSDERDAVMAALPTARPRLDSLRLITSPDFLLLRR